MSGTSGDPGERGGALHRLGALLAGAQFAAFVVVTCALLELAFVALLLLPSGGELGDFADQFRTLCYGRDPATGAMQPMMIGVLLLEPLGLGGLVAAVWSRPLRQAWRGGRRALLRPAVAAATLVIGLGIGLARVDVQAETGELPFPAEALRVHNPAPDLCGGAAPCLVDQSGAPTDLAALRGKVVVLTAIYARCGQACPTIFARARSAVEALSPAQQAEVVVAAVSLDPARDTPEILAGLAAAQGLGRPGWRLLTGEPARVEAALDRMEVARQRDPATGEIAHASVFLLLDRDGTLAYRLGLDATGDGARRQRWLGAAIRSLLGGSAA